MHDSSGRLSGPHKGHLLAPLAFLLLLGCQGAGAPAEAGADLAPAPSPPGQVSSGDRLPPCEDEPGKVARAAARVHPGWRRGGEIRAIPLGRTAGFAYYSACWLTGATPEERCEPIVLGRSCAATVLSERADALAEALPRGADAFVALEARYADLPVPPTWDPARPQDGVPATDYTMQFPVPPEKALLLFELLVHFKFGSQVSGLPQVQLGGMAERRADAHDNAPWSFGIAPATVERMQEYEECDSWPAFIEQNLDAWLRRPRPYTCPWGLAVIALVYRDASTGRRSLLVQRDYAPARGAIGAYYQQVHGRRAPPLGEAALRDIDAVPLLPQ